MASSAATSAATSAVPRKVPDELKKEIIIRIIGKHRSNEIKQYYKYIYNMFYDYEYSPYDKNIINIFHDRSLIYKYNIKTGGIRKIERRPNGKSTTTGPESFGFIRSNDGKRLNNRGNSTNKILAEYKKKLAEEIKQIQDDKKKEFLIIKYIDESKREIKS
jgi:hypothetical protein